MINFIKKFMRKLLPRKVCVDAIPSGRKNDRKEEALKGSDEIGKKTPKILILPCKLESKRDTKNIQNRFREQNTVMLINIKSKKYDLAELKRLINPIKRTVESVDGGIGAISSEWIVVTPRFIDIYKSEPPIDKKAAKDSYD